MLNEKQQNLENLKKLEGLLESSLTDSKEGEAGANHGIESGGDSHAKLIAF